MNDLLLDQFVQSIPTHPNLSRLWLHDLTQRRAAGLPMHHIRTQATQALSLFPHYPDLSMGQIALLLLLQNKSSVMIET